jgi:alkaline phosphatase D
MKRCSFIVILLVISASLQAQKPQDQFCFQGHTTTNSVRFWCTLPSEVTDSVVFFVGDGKTVEKQLISGWKSYKSSAYQNFEFDGLLPGTSYELGFEDKSGHITKLLSFNTYPESRDSLSLLIGACAMKTFGIQKVMKPGRKFPIYRTMAEEDADAMLWMGDNLYFLLEANSDRKQIRKHLQTKKVPDLQHFLAALPQYAMWDDHDFGPNNSDGSFPYKHLSFKNFNDFWANPAPVDSSQGIYYKISFPQADVFMIDNRFQAISEVNFMGKKQMLWLEDGLRSSQKPFKFIITGIQAGNKQTTHESLYPTGEWDSILNIIRTHQVEGVIFVNGDRHHSEIFRHEEKGLYPVYEYTNSPLTSYVGGVGKKSPEYDNPARIRGVTAQFMYGKIRIVPFEDSWKCILDAIDEKGNLLWDLHIPLSELSFPSKP